MDEQLGIDVEIDRGLLVAAAEALLHAGIPNRDLLSVMPIGAQLKMPPDISRRLADYRYQSLFDEMPADVRAEAQSLVEADPSIIEAKRIDAGITDG